MEVHKDFADLCSLLNGKQVEYLVIGGYAVAFHGAPRFTADLDLFVRPTSENVARMLEALREFGFPTEGVEPSYLMNQGKILQLGTPPVQVHLMLSVSGVTWEDAWAGRVRGTYGDVELFFIGRAALVANKRASNRTKDLADIEALGG